jgi:RHS repeat-associated protein
VGDITGLQDEMPASNEHQAFQYDGLYRLGSFEVRQNDAAGAVLRAGTYGYDDEGNIQQFGETQPLTYTYGNAAHPGRLTGVTSPAGLQVVDYNSLGHVSAFGEMASLEYDPLDRLVRVVRNDGTEIRFAYDPQSRRILKKVTQGGVTTTVRYATGLFEQHENHAIRHIYLGKQLIASVRITAAGEAPLFYASDHHGTILLATDSAGAVIHNQRYTPFGAALNPADDLDRYLGRERDVETGLLQFGVRYYAPALGRFISPDWWVIENPTKAARMPQGYALYSYALNNPLVFKDPSGMWFLIDDLIVAAVGFVVGFFTGLIYGLANGQGWDSLLTALETGLTTAAGAWLGWNVAGVFGAVMGGMNGLISGIHGVYDWTSIDGWFAFISDSTWGLLGTSLGNIIHIVNLFWSGSNYREDLSRRQNRHVYEGGMYLKDGFAFTQGNVISNAGGNVGLDPSTPAGRRRLQFIADHEELHIWQSRFFGPLFQATYIVWGIGGFLVGTVVWFFNTDEDYGSIIETAAYYDNPFEYWAYNNDNNWPPGGANPIIAWS